MTTARRELSSAGAYLALCFGWSWVCWALALVLARPSVWSGPSLVLLWVGGAGPALAGLLCVGGRLGRRGLRDLGWRLLDPRRIGPWAWAIILLLVPALTLVSAAMARALWPDATFAWPAFPLEPGELALSLAYLLVFGPLPEEIGWRGFLLDRLQTVTGPVRASLLLGLIWGAWHLPLFLMPDFHAGAQPDPIRWTVEILSASMLITAVYNRSRRSVMAAVLFHFSINAAAAYAPLEDRAAWIKTAAMACAGLVAALLAVRRPIDGVV